MGSIIIINSLTFLSLSSPSPLVHVWDQTYSMDMLHTVEDHMVQILSLIRLTLGVDFHIGYYTLPTNEITTNIKFLWNFITPIVVAIFTFLNFLGEKIHKFSSSPSRRQNARLRISSTRLVTTQSLSHLKASGRARCNVFDFGLYH